MTRDDVTEQDVLAYELLQLSSWASRKGGGWAEVLTILL